jgi:hypothetical protein
MSQHDMTFAIFSKRADARPRPQRLDASQPAREAADSPRGPEPQAELCTPNRVCGARRGGFLLGCRTLDECFGSQCIYLPSTPVCTT